jgi:hypothetical protein
VAGGQAGPACRVPHQERDDGVQLIWSAFDAAIFGGGLLQMASAIATDARVPESGPE